MPHHHRKNLGKYSVCPQPTMLNRIPKGDTGKPNRNAVLRHNEFRKYQENLRQRFSEVDGRCKQEVNGYWRIPDWNKYYNWAWEVQQGEHRGNCWETNFALYEKLRKSSGDTNLMLYVFRIDNGIIHTIVLDGDIMYDYSQFREIKQSLHDYQRINKVIAHSLFTEKDYQKALKSGDAFKYFYEGIAEDVCKGRFQYRGELKPMPNSMELAMRSIINL
jgi:hypothetical protein